MERLKLELAELEAKAFTPEKRDRILVELRMGKQSPQYKRVKAALDQMML